MNLAWLLGLVLAAPPGMPEVERDPVGRPGEPGSGLPREKAGPSRPEKLLAPLPRRPRDDAEAQGINELEMAAARYRHAAEATMHSLRSLLVIQANEGERQLRASYEQRIRKHQAKARVLRAKAIARYEDFLKLHPNDPNWTPEIMFRLAELEFDAATERLARQEQAWDKAVAALERRREELDNPDYGDIPPSPVADYSRAVSLYRKITGGFPRYAHNDAVLYQMGVLLYEQEDYDSSRQTFLALVCPEYYPVPDKRGGNVIPSKDFKQGDYQRCNALKADSIYNVESWLRTGEAHYDSDEYQPALEAYSRATEDKNHKLYAAGLIRKAWTLYLKGEFQSAAEDLDAYIRYADSVKGTEASEGATEYREVAVKYLALTYSEPDWDRDGRPDRRRGLARLNADYAERRGEPHVAEIYAALGDRAAFSTDYDDAIKIWKTALARWPTAPKAPTIQDRILQAYDALQDQEGAWAARDALATNYLRGTPWFYANEDKPDVLEEAMALAEGALVATAVDHHERAQTLRAGGEEEKAKGEYAIAAKAYEAYLERFPATKSSYEYRYNFAEALFYSDQFLKAAQTYIEVRDSNLHDAYQRDSADGAVAAYVAYIQAEEDAGRLALPDMPKIGPKGETPAVARADMPEVVVALQAAYDRQAALNPDSKNTPQGMFLAASLSQRYHRFDESYPRYMAILQRHCDSEYAVGAGTAIIDGYTVRGDLKAVREWGNKLGEMNCGGEASEEFAGSLRTIVAGARFKEARLLAEAGEHEAAADRYMALVKENPGDRNADAALNNAAVSYERIGRFSSAAAAFRQIYESYRLCDGDENRKIKKSRAAKPCSEFVDDALERTAFNHSRFFEYEQAVRTLRILAEDPEFETSDKRPQAITNAARLMESLQQYERSARFYRQAAGGTEDPTKKANYEFEAAKVEAKIGDARKTISAFQRFLKNYGDQADQGEHAVEAWLQIARAHQASERRRAAEKAYRQTIDTFAARGIPMATDAADFPAEAAFKLAEYKLEDAKNIKLNTRNLVKGTQRLEAAIVEVNQDMVTVTGYLRIEWALAAYYMQGHSLEAMSQKLQSAPVPFGEYSDEWFAYTEAVQKYTDRFDLEAVKKYQATLAHAQKDGVANEWTRRARERLNVYLPDQYPLLRDPGLSLRIEDRR